MSPNIVENRFELDKLYEKSENNKIRIKDFCKNETCIDNYERHGCFPEVKIGMFHIYIIPKIKFNIELNNEFKNNIIEQSKKMKRYYLYDIKINRNVEFKKASYSKNSIILRNNNISLTDNTF